MVLDHVLVVAGPSTWGSVVRLTVTRASLPLFCVVAGALMGGTVRWRRLGLVVAAGVVSTVLGAPIGIGQPDVLLLLAVALAVAPWLSRWHLVAALVVATIQPVTWAVPWSGYQPGTVLVLVLVGAMAGRELVAGWGFRCRAVEWVGRRPLCAYVVHLLLLRLAVAL